MIEVNDLKDVLDYIDNGITNNNNKTHYILYISLIHDYFLNLEGIDFGIRYKILKQCNLLLTKLIDSENGKLRNDWIMIRNLILPDIVEKNEELNKADRYFKSL